MLVFNYLHRPLMPALVDALEPGGVLIYETFTVGQAERGHPRNPAFLLGDGELPRLVAPLEVIRERGKGSVDGKLVSSIVARTPLIDATVVVECRLPRTPKAECSSWSIANRRTRVYQVLDRGVAAIPAGC